MQDTTVIHVYERWNMYCRPQKEIQSLWSEHTFKAMIFTVKSVIWRALPVRISLCMQPATHLLSGSTPVVLDVVILQNYTFSPFSTVAIWKCTPHSFFHQDGEKECSPYTLFPHHRGRKSSKSERLSLPICIAVEPGYCLAILTQACLPLTKLIVANHPLFRYWLFCKCTGTLLHGFSQLGPCSRTLGPIGFTVDHTY